MGNKVEPDQKKVPMRVITINVPQYEIDFFKKVVAYGRYPSRSEGMRDCIRIAKSIIINDIKETERIIAMDSIPTMRQFLNERGYELVKKGKYNNAPGRQTKRRPLGNVMWEDLKLKSGEVVRVPKDLIEGYINE